MSLDRVTSCATSIMIYAHSMVMLLGQIIHYPTKDLWLLGFLKFHYKWLAQVPKPRFSCGVIGLISILIIVPTNGERLFIQGHLESTSSLSKIHSRWLQTMNSSEMGILEKTLPLNYQLHLITHLSLLEWNLNFPFSPIVGIQLHKPLKIVNT
jgi:hypothetical protein